MDKKGIRLTTNPLTSNATSMEPVLPIQIRSSSIPPTTSISSGFRPRMSSICAADMPALIRSQFATVIGSGGTSSQIVPAPIISTTPMIVVNHSHLRRIMRKPEFSRGVIYPFKFHGPS